MYRFELEREVARQRGRLRWYQNYILKILEEEKADKNNDYSIELASELQRYSTTHETAAAKLVTKASQWHKIGRRRRRRKGRGTLNLRITSFAGNPDWQSFVLNSPQPKSKLGPTTQIEPFKDDSLMKPIEPEVLDILYKCSDNLGSEKYLKARYRKKTEERYHLRLSTTWDYGWELKKSVVSPRDVNYGRCAVIKGSFYRTKNLAPDPWYYNEPTMGDPTFCK
ncbi:hypothetical protein EVAR_77301_1 [Eumeta japonica]|uniref:Sperm microtubule inner protein 1 C-terminal domain-containing protein n=1 Tax=Eumeta variegata TaxID=151549 RepID=A0A4C1UMG2_EUMVA|nr:hypothetical protein EVAR_77301_1 [Eumeta japonica]